MKHAECSKPEVDPEWFFPGRGKSNDIQMAQFICFVCPVRLDCQDYRIKTKSIGIWHGENFSEG